MQSPNVTPEVHDAVSELPRLVPLADVAAFFQVTERTAREWARTPGKLRVFRTAKGGSGRVFALRSEVARLLATMRDRQAFETE